jgi:hypothetical protein
MKLQDKHKYDSTVEGLENHFLIDSEDNFFINSPAIISLDTTLIRNQTYLLIDSVKDKNGKMYPVLFLDAYFKDGMVYLFVQDMLTQRIFTLDLCLECTDEKNKWVLIDLKYTNKLMDYKTIKSYCGKC